MIVNDDEIIEKTILSYCFGYNKYKINFDFREDHYKLEQNEGNYLYSRQKTLKKKRFFISWHLMKKLNGLKMIF